jgi:hypothetical protein
MTTTPNQPPSDRPQILLDATDLFGRKSTQKVSPEVNRQNPHDEFRIGWDKLLALPDTTYDALLQVGVWVGLGAFTPTILGALSFPTVLTYPILLVSGSLLIVGAVAARRNLFNAFPLLYRVALLATGVAIAMYAPSTANLLNFLEF